MGVTYIPYNPWREELLGRVGLAFIGDMMERTKTREADSRAGKAIQHAIADKAPTEALPHFTSAEYGRGLNTPLPIRTMASGGVSVPSDRLAEAGAAISGAGRADLLTAIAKRAGLALPTPPAEQPVTPALPTAFQDGRWISDYPTSNLIDFNAIASYNDPRGVALMMRDIDKIATAMEINNARKYKAYDDVLSRGVKADAAELLARYPGDEQASRLASAWMALAKDPDATKAFAAEGSNIRNVDAERERTTADLVGYERNRLNELEKARIYANAERGKSYPYATGQSGGVSSADTFRMNTIYSNATKMAQAKLREIKDQNPGKTFTADEDAEILAKYTNFFYEDEMVRRGYGAYVGNSDGATSPQTAAPVAISPHKIDAVVEKILGDSSAVSYLYNGGERISDARIISYLQNSGVDPHQVIGDTTLANMLRNRIYERRQNGGGNNGARTE